MGIRDSSSTARYGCPAALPTGATATIIGALFDPIGTILLLAIVSLGATQTVTAKVPAWYDDALQLLGGGDDSFDTPNLYSCFQQ